MSYEYLLEQTQECIPVGCVPPVAVFPATHAPATHAPLPCMPPVMHAPLPRMPLTTDALLTHMPPPPHHLQNSGHTYVKILPCRNFVAGGNDCCELTFPENLGHIPMKLKITLNSIQHLHLFPVKSYDDLE